MHHARKPSMHLNSSPSQLTSRHVTSLATPVQTCLDSPQVLRLGVCRRAPRTYLLTGRAVTASCPATAPVHVWKAPRCLGSFKSPHKGRAGGQPPKMPGCKGDATGTGERSSMFPTRPHRGQADPTTSALPAALPQQDHYYATST